MRYKKFIKEFKSEYKKDKLKFSIYFILRGLVILCLILQLLKGEFENAALCFLSLILLLLPFFIEHSFKIDLPNTLEIIIMIFVSFLGYSSFVLPLPSSYVAAVSA